MTHQYRAEDFADLPQKALEALGVRCIASNETVTCINHPTLLEALPHDAAAAMLIGMVQARCNWMQVHVRHDDWECQLYVYEHLRMFYGSARSPLSAVLSAYAAALGQQQEARP